MRIAVTCPFCAQKGKLPDAMRGQRKKCAGCHQPFAVPALKPAERPPARPLAAMLDEDEAPYHVRPLPIASYRSSAQAGAPHSTPLATYAAIALGGVCALLLAVVTIHSLSGGSRQKTKPEPIPDHVVHREPIKPTPPAPSDTSETSESDRAAAVAQRKKSIVDATVYLKLSSRGRLIGSGTGFVIRDDKDAILLATNRHVANAETDDRGKVEITADFRSGQGPALKQSLPAENVAIGYS
jgi:hypothetical protein